MFKPFQICVALVFLLSVGIAGAAEEKQCDAERIKIAEGAIRLAQEEIRQGRVGSWPQFIKQRQEFIKTCRAKVNFAANDQETPEKFKQWVMSTKTVMGVPLFSRVDIQGNVLTLGLRDQRFMSPNWALFADLGDAFAKWCSCEAITHVTYDLSHVGIDLPPLLTFVYDPVRKRSVLSH